MAQARVLALFALLCFGTVLADYATCIVWGDPHYTTFDGMAFTFMDSNDHYMALVGDVVIWSHPYDCYTNELAGDGHSIYGRKATLRRDDSEGWGGHGGNNGGWGQGPTPTCIEYIVVQYKGKAIRLSAMGGLWSADDATLNWVTRTFTDPGTTITDTLDDTTITISDPAAFNRFGNGYTVRMYNPANNLDIVIDTAQWFLQISVNRDMYRNKVAGTCGYLDDYPPNDIIKKDCTVIDGIVSNNEDIIGMYEGQLQPFFDSWQKTDDNIQPYINWAANNCPVPPEGPQPTPAPATPAPAPDNGAAAAIAATAGASSGPAAAASTGPAATSGTGNGNDGGYTAGAASSSGYTGNNGGSSGNNGASSGNNGNNGGSSGNNGNNNAGPSSGNGAGPSSANGASIGPASSGSTGTNGPATPAPDPVTPAPATPAPDPVTPAPATPAPDPVTPAPATPAPDPVTPAPATPAPATPAPDPVTPAPVTPAPATPAPATPAPDPVTPAPATPAPATPAPATPAPDPVTPAPATPAPDPVTPAPATPAPDPVTPAPSTPAPVTPAPATPAPVTPAPATPAPATPAPVTPAPVTPAPKPVPTQDPHDDHCDIVYANDAQQEAATVECQNAGIYDELLCACKRKFVDTNQNYTGNYDLTFFCLSGKTGVFPNATYGEDVVRHCQNAIPDQTSYSYCSCIYDHNIGGVDLVAPSGSAYYVTCSKSSTSCYSYAACKDACSYNGKCVDGKCQCNDGYSGDNCAKKGLTKAAKIAVITAGALAGIIIAAIAFVALSGYGGVKGYLYLKDHQISGAHSNPLYNERPTNSNPFYNNK